MKHRVTAAFRASIEVIALDPIRPAFAPFAKSVVDYTGKQLEDTGGFITCER
jgi:hypothetical protein